MDKLKGPKRPKKSEEGKITVTTTMSKAYQITVPSVIRKALGLEPGDPVDFDLRGHEAILVRAETQEEKIKRTLTKLDKIRENLPTEAKANMRKYAGWTASQLRDHYYDTPEGKAEMERKYGRKN